MGNELANFIDKKVKPNFSACPSGMAYESEKSFAIQLLTANQYLMNVAQANKASLVDAITNVAHIGLSLNPAEKLAYLIPRNVKINDKWVGKICLEPSYMGLIKLATDSGSIEWVQAVCVYHQDTFVDNGPGERPTHNYDAFSDDRGILKGVYCVAKTKGGDYLTTLMTKKEIDDIMARSESGKKGQGPWKTDYNEQAKKTVIRRAFKTWPRTDLNRMALAVDISNENEGFEPLVSSPDIKSFTAEQKNYFDQLITNSDALGMYVFSKSFDLSDASSNGASIWTSLLHSFERGKKGQYQRLVEELKAQGEDLYMGILDAVIMGLNENDDIAVKELVMDLDDETINLLLSEFNLEQHTIYQEMLADD